MPSFAVFFEPPNPLPPPTAFRYDTYDTTGAVAEPGSYAFLADPADTTSVVTNYEALRDGTTTALLIHKSDAHGASQAALYDAVEAGDLFEWHEADDCFVRYTVTEVKTDPAGAVPRKLLAVEWMTYAYTGCSGAISADAEVGMTSGNMLDLGGVGLRAPVVHGTHHLIPENWEGKKEALTRHDPPDRSPDDEESVATTLEAARALEFPYWREPNPLPEGWKLRRAWYGGFEAPLWGFCSAYYTEPPGKSLKACGAFNTVRRFSEESSYLVETGLVVRETRVIAGRPAMILWSPPGPQYVWYLDIHILVDDPETESAYEFIYSGPRRSDSDGNARLAEALDLVTSFFEREQARPFIRPRPDNKPHIGATVVTTVFSVETSSPRYNSYDTTGEVSGARQLRLPRRPRRHDERRHHLRGAARRHDDGAADPQVRRPRRLAGRALRRRRGRRPLRVARGRRLLRALQGDRGQARPGRRRASQAARRRVDDVRLHRVQRRHLSGR